MTTVWRSVLNDKEVGVEERMRILELIEAGEISAEDGARRLEALIGTDDGTEAPITPPVPVVQPAVVRWVWQCVFWVGGALAAGGPRG